MYILCVGGVGIKDICDLWLKLHTIIFKWVSNMLTEQYQRTIQT